MALRSLIRRSTRPSTFFPSCRHVSILPSLTTKPTQPPSIQGGASSPLVYCRSLVQRLDNDSYLTAYFWPQGRQRDAFFAIRAFNIELATIQETVSNPDIGRLRIQFWKDALSDISNGRPPPQHPVALALSQTLTPQTLDLTHYYLSQILTARLANIHDPSPPTLLSLLTTLSTTSTPLHLLLLSLLNPTPPAPATPSVQHLSLAIGLTNLLRSVPWHASKGRMPGLPLDLCAREGVVSEEVFRKGGGAEGVSEVCWEVAVRANDELRTARREWAGEEWGGKVEKGVMPVFLGAYPVQSYLTRLEKLQGDAFDPSLRTRHWRVPLDMWIGHKRNKF